MADFDDTDRRSAGEALGLLPRLWRCEQALEALHARLTATHYGLCAYLAERALGAEETLTTETGEILAQLVLIRRKLQRARALLSRVLT